MNIVIKIDEDVFTRLFDNGTEDYAIVNDDLFAIAKAIRKCKVLPEHHGDLIDRNNIEVLRLGNLTRQYDKGFDAGVTCMVNRILDAPTIIEADKRRSRWKIDLS